MSSKGGWRKDWGIYYFHVGVHALGAKAQPSFESSVQLVLSARHAPPNPSPLSVKPVLLSFLHRRFP